uniref:Uncharacterized protein n=1 Tax=Anopheles arabiensis TaxID=7173 RepID=A0A182IGZ4_ANOAR
MCAFMVSDVSLLVVARRRAAAASLDNERHRR